MQNIKIFEWIPYNQLNDIKCGFSTYIINLECHFIFMYNENLLSENFKLFYQQENDKGSWNPSTIFVSRNDQYYPSMSKEAECLITFFSQNLSNNIQDPLPIYKTPTFTLSENLLSLNEIGENNQNTQVNNLSKRIWISHRTQTLFHTITGFMNYSKAIKSLYRVENPDIIVSCANDPEKISFNGSSKI
ncbi:Glycosyltransferase Family 48 protein [Glomus cerebriforme]|uniref:Glycosyltransferase Family 48 protein n=1 Tax=Glomus cerebriforme TaxID=658196 RepID=A0A397TJC1_9GLOM|nr:Glycosyltransferase Family 48 protein [Glomus cerebriforme]